MARRRLELLRHGTPLTKLRKAVGVALGALLGAVALVALAGLPVYVFPPSEEVGKADLIYVIGPPVPPRIELAERLRADGVASEVLISVSPATDTIRYPASELPVCAEDGVTCQTPKPFTTKGEALLLTEYTAQRPSAETVVITFTPHVARTRYIFDKCYDGEVTVVGVDQSLSLGDWIYQYVYQTSAFVKAWITAC